MKCLYCNCTESKVVDSRSSDDARTIRRRRECVSCGRRFTTYETIEVTPVLVVKNNGMRQAFNAEKVRNGIIKSCEKRPVPMAVIDEIVADISKQVYNSMESEITSKQIGEMVMERLKKNGRSGVCTLCFRVSLVQGYFVVYGGITEHDERKIRRFFSIGRGI